MSGTLNQSCNLVQGRARSESLHGCLRLLALARAYARDVECDVWEFAVELDMLLAEGATTNDIRWLIKKGYAEHAHETPLALGGSCDRRTFHGHGGLCFSSRSCLVLTTSGALMFGRYCQRGECDLSSSLASPNCPCWDGQDRTLRFGRDIVKRYRVPAPNQELVLAAFEEEAWPSYIDDPLPPAPGVESRFRLRDTISRLNRHQHSPLLRFFSNGRGRAIGWKLCPRDARSF